MLGELIRRLKPIGTEETEEWMEACGRLAHAEYAVFYPGSALDVTPVRLLENDGIEKLLGMRTSFRRVWLFCDYDGAAAGALQRIYGQLDRGFTADDDPDAGPDRIDIDHICRMIPLRFAGELSAEWRQSEAGWHEDASVPWQAMYICLIAPNGREADLLFVPADSRRVWKQLIERYIGSVLWVFNLKHGGYELAAWMKERENCCLPEFWCEDRGSDMAALWAENSVIAEDLWMHGRNLRIMKNPGSRAGHVNLLKINRAGDEACRARREVIRLMLRQGQSGRVRSMAEENIAWLQRRMKQDGGPVRFRYHTQYDPGCTDFLGADDRMARRAELFEAFLHRQAASGAAGIGAEAEEMIAYFRKRDPWEPGVFQAFADGILKAAEQLFFWEPLALYIGRQNNELEEALLEAAYRQGKKEFARCLIENGFGGAVQTRLFSIVMKYDPPKAQEVAGRLNARCIAWILRDTCARSVSREAEMIFGCISEETAEEAGCEIKKYRRKWPGCIEAYRRLTGK